MYKNFTKKLEQYLLKEFFKEETKNFPNKEQSRKHYPKKPEKVANLLWELDSQRLYSDILVKISQGSFDSRVDLCRKIEKDLHEETKVFKYIPYFRIKVERKDTKSAVKSLKKNSYVIATSVSKLVMIPELGDVLKFSTNAYMWNLKNIGADIAQLKTKGEHIKVATIDTGVDYNHSELFDVYEYGYDFCNAKQNPMDDNGHGTHVSGIIAGKTVGVAPKCRLFAAKVLNKDGWGTEYDILRAIEWCIDHEIDIINMSLGSPVYSEAERDMIESAYLHGILICAAAGNDYAYAPDYPAAYEHVISVAAVDIDNQHADFSNIHSTVDISAPGVGVYSSIPGNRYNSFSGTSMATPHVAGSAALLKSLYYEQPDMLEKIILSTAQRLGNITDPINKDMYGAGLIRADQMVQNFIANKYKNKQIA